MTISADTRPRLAPKVRLRFDRKSSRYMLLYPERGLALNGTAADIVRLCTGEHTVAAIVERLASQHAPEAPIEREVFEFLTAMADRGLLEDAE